MDNFTVTYKQLAEQRYRLLDITGMDEVGLTKVQKVAIEKAYVLLKEVEDWMRKLKDVVKIDN